MKVNLNEDRILLNSLTRACHLRHDKVRTRLPIKKHLLNRIIDATERYFALQPYLMKLYKAMFATAYYGLLRIGEITTSEHVVKAGDVQIGVNKNKLLFILRSSKTHSKGSKPQQIKISSTAVFDTDFNDERNTHCPFSIIRAYLEVRKDRIDDMEQFFVFSDRSPVKPHHMRSTLKNIIKTLGKDESLFETHSFRSGRSIDLM